MTPHSSLNRVSDILAVRNGRMYRLSKVRMSHISPTLSSKTENIDAEINVLQKEFQVDKAYLQKNFYAPNNYEKKLWFFKHFLNQRHEIQEKFYALIHEYQVHISFLIGLKFMLLRII